MDDIAPLDSIKRLFNEAFYIHLSTIEEDGSSYPSNVRVAHGHSLSLYFLTETDSNKAFNIGRDPRVSGSLLINMPEPGKGVNLFFKGLAHQVSLTGDSPSLLPATYAEREIMIKSLSEGRKDYRESVDKILSGQANLGLYRIVLTEAWYNGGIRTNGSQIETNLKAPLKIVGDKACPLIRRYFVDGNKTIPDHVVEISPTQIRAALKL